MLAIGQEYVDIGGPWFSAVNKPLCTWGNAGRFQGFVKANEMPGAVTLLSFNFLAAESTTNQSWGGFKIHACHSDKTSLGTNFADNFSGNTPQLVYSIVTMTVSTVSDEWFGWEFDPPFKYNGNSNLVIELSYDSPNGSISIKAGNGTNRCLFKNKLSSPTGDFLGNDMAMRIYYKSNTDIEKNKNKSADKMILRLTGSHVSVSLPNSLKSREVSLAIYSVTGKKVYTGKEVVYDKGVDCDISNLSPGIYTFVTTYEGAQFMRKFCVMRWWH